MPRFCRHIRLWWLPPDPRTEESVQFADRWYKNLPSPLEKKEGQWQEIELYAKQKYDEKMSVFRNLDAKAEKLFQFSAGAAGAVFAIAKMMDGALSELLLLAYFAFAIAMLFSTRIHAPMWTAQPLRADLVIDQADSKSKDELRSRIAASYHVAATVVEVADGWKAAQIRRIHYMFVGGVLLVLTGLVSAYFNAQSSSPEGAYSRSEPTQPALSPLFRPTPTGSVPGGAAGEESNPMSLAQGRLE